MLTNWQRLEKVVAWTGLSVNAFAKCIGLKRAENLYQIKKGNYGISKDLADMISAKYITINKSWLLTGMGQMFLDDNRHMAANIPCYKVDIVKLMLSPGRYSPLMYISAPMLEHSEFGATTLSRAMEPEIPYSSTVFVKKTDIENLSPGNMYLVMSRTFNDIRFVRREPGSPVLRLVPLNKQDFDEVIIDTGDLDALYEIKGFLVIK